MLREVLHYLEQNRNHFIAFKLLALIRDRVFGALRRLCPARLEGRDKGNLVSVITSDIELLEVFYAHTISPIAIGVLFSILMTVFIGSIDYRLGILAAFAYVTVGGLMPMVSSRLSGDCGTEMRERSGELSTVVLENLRGLDDIQQYGAGDARVCQMVSRTDGLNEVSSKMNSASGKASSITVATMLLFDLCMLVCSYLLFRDGAIGFDGALISVIAMMSSFGPVAALAALGSTLQTTVAAGNRVLDILDDDPETEDVTGKGTAEFGDVSAGDVSFSYGGDKVLSGVSVEVLEGTIVGISGRSGSGKTTLLKLMMRFWDPDSGTISISGRPIDGINTSELRGMESYVTQDTHLFRDTIRNNLKIAKLDASDEEIVEACRKASIHDFISGLPDGYDTQVGELGDTLSGGERQRIGLARAFLHGAPFMLLDEPTSNLDSLNESVILRSISEAGGEHTVVIVSHRASTLCIADRIYAMDSGRVS